MLAWSTCNVESAACLSGRLALRRKLVSSAKAGSSTGDKSSLVLEDAILSKAFAAVSLVISLRSLSSIACKVQYRSEYLQLCTDTRIDGHHTLKAGECKLTCSLLTR